VTSTAASLPYRWGRLRLVRLDAGTTFHAVMGGLSLERYLLGLAEVPASWPDAALDAQAIAGRSFASVTVRLRRASPGWTVPWDLESGQSDQVFHGSAIELASWGAPWVAAVGRTAGVVVRGPSGFALSTNYSSANGGHVESSAYVWGSTNFWLVAAPDPFDGPNPYSDWRPEFGRGELRRWIRDAGFADPGRIERIRVTGEVGESGRVDRATIGIVGTRATVAMTGNQFRFIVNGAVIADGTSAQRLLRSTRFTIRPIRT
jgi:SpoIID/LytB domain protein